MHSKIGYLVSEYPAYSHTFILREVLGLRARGIDIHVASINNCKIPPKKRDLDEKKEAEKTFYVKSQGFWKALGVFFLEFFRSPLLFLSTLGYALWLGGTDIKAVLFGFFYFIEALLIGRWMREKELSHLHVHFANPAAHVALLASKLFPITFSLTVHGPDEFDFAVHNRVKEKVAHAKFVICIGNFAQSQVMKWTEIKDHSKLIICRLGIDVNHFTYKFRPLGTQPIEVLCVGRLVATKGQLILIQAAKEVIQKGYDLRIRFIGGGPDFSALQEQTKREGLQDKISFTGPLSQEKVKEAYLTADLFVLPSFAEGIPVSLMEAMASGVPCISTFVCGIPELIRHEVDGLLTVPSCTEELSNAIITLIQQPALRESYALSARNRVMQDYNFEKNCDQLAQIFTSHI